jgi:phosphate transport system substrate-binding protein
MHTFSILADLGDPISQFWIGVASLALSALAIAITVIMTLRGRQRKLLTHEVVSNSSVINVENDVGEDLKLVLEGQVVTKVRLHMIKLLNAGNTAISSEDYPNQLSFEFNSPPYPQPLIRCAIHRTEPETLLPAHQLKTLLSIDEPERKVMILKPPLLNPREAIFLKVLLLADHRDSTSMNVIGQIKEGTIKKYKAPQTRITGRMVIAGILVAFVLGLLISNSIGLITAFTQGGCAFGTVQDSGSTSFYSTVAKEAANYNAVCPSQIAHIVVNQSSSGSGLADLENGTVQIANSELRSLYTDQVDHPVAVIVFALIVNKSVNISSLNMAQIQQIYSGNDTFWDQVAPGAAHIPIKVIGRSSSSGTHSAFVKYVLGGTETPLPAGSTIVDRSAEVVNAVANTNGAIGYADLGDVNKLVTTLDINQYPPTPALIEKGAYQFWAIEHMYTRSNPDGLSRSFITYVIQDLQSNGTFIRLSAMDPTILAAHSS